MDNHDSCCHTPEKAQSPDWVLLCSAALLFGSIALHLCLTLVMGGSPLYLHHFTHAIIEMLGSMWWGVAIGIIIVGLMGKIPRDFFTALMGRDNSISGLFRAVFAGLFLDLCCHGILLVAGKLYERGVSMAQVATFLIASPWNSVSLTLVLVGLIGLKWTLLYIIGSAIIALISGFILQKLTKSGVIPDNTNKSERAEDLNLKQEFIVLIKSISLSKNGMIDILKSGWHDGKVIIKWLLFGTLIAAALRTFIPADIFAMWLGPSIAGLFITLFIATIIEICSEGSAPIAGEIVTGAHAAGNGFTFLMAGVATDYTEMLAIRAFTGSWKIAIAIPIITVPQVLFIGWLMNTL